MIASLPPEQACKLFSCAPSQRGSAIFRHRYIASGYAPREDLERVTRLELATSSLARRCSTTELHPRKVGSNNRSHLRQRKIFCESRPAKHLQKIGAWHKRLYNGHSKVVAEECCESLMVTHRDPRLRSE